MESQPEIKAEAQVQVQAQPKPTRVEFCAPCQKDTPHEMYVQLNREYVFSCTTCGDFKKFAPGTTKEQMEKYFDAHRESSKGQVLAETENKELKALHDDLVSQMADKKADKL